MISIDRFEGDWAILEWEGRTFSSPGVLSVHVLDVGQADAIVARLPDDRVILVDAGASTSADTVTGFLQDAGVEGPASTARS